MKWESVIGLEIHVQLATRSKIFSGASTRFGAPPNTQASALDLALPGTLPVLNAEAVRMAVTFGLAIGAEVSRRCHFDRKNYFYPDLPKGYQISQLDSPIVGRGRVELALPGGGSRSIGITRAHLEEDAAKSLHESFSGHTGVDLNRSGMPLLEIVSDPDLRSPEDAAQYFRQMHGLVRYLGICDGNLNEGSMRCDANVSVRPEGADTFGVRTEIKNLNSFRFLERAVRHEIARQIAILERGGEVQRETLLYDPELDATRPMRSKELSDDYRYFPEPDLLPVEISEAYIEEVRSRLPELPDAKRARYQADLGLGDYDARRLTNDPDMARFFEQVAARSGLPKQAANWVLGELAAAIGRGDGSHSMEGLPLTPEQLAALILRVEDGTLSGRTAKALFEALWEQGDPAASVDALIESRGLRQVSDESHLEVLVAEAIAAHPKQVEQYRSGKDKVFGFFVGRIMQATAGKANPQQLNEILRAALDGR